MVVTHGRPYPPSATWYGIKWTKKAGITENPAGESDWKAGLGAGGAFDDVPPTAGSFVQADFYLN